MPAERRRPFACGVGRPPDGYHEDREGGCCLWVRDEDAPRLAQAGFTAAGEPRLTPSDLAGRRPLLELATGRERLLVRRFRHGGLLRWLTGNRFLDAGRPFRELRLSEELRRRGLPTPQVVAARARPAVGVGWRLELVSRRVDDALDLSGILSRLQAGSLARGKVRALLRPLGAFLSRLHGEGLMHADLQPANLLVSRSTLDGGAASFWVLDLDRSELGAELDLRARSTNLSRLLRHVVRRRAEGGPGVMRADLARVLAGYEPDRAARHALWRDIESDLRRDIARHRLGWWLERLLGRSGERRG